MRTLALAFLVTLSGCSGDDNDTDTDASASATSQGSTTAGTAATDASATTNGTTAGTTGTDSDGTAGTTDATTAGTTDATTDATTTAATSETGTTTDATTDATTTGTTDATTDATTGGGADPNWPPPDLDMPMMPCPEGFEAAQFAMGGIVCSPKCTGIGNMCPKAETGTAVGQCVFNPESSGMMCTEMNPKCDDAMETCVMTGGGGMACLKKSDHCVLLCSQGETCPDGMECFGKQLCQYPVG